MVLRTIGPRITGPWDLGCLGSKVRGPKVRGSKALGLIILEPAHLAVRESAFYWVSRGEVNVLEQWRGEFGRN